MIPCRSSCPHYAEGCHKTCAYWKSYQRELQDQQRKKMQWLKAQNEVCTGHEHGAPRLLLIRFLLLKTGRAPDRFTRLRARP